MSERQRLFAHILCGAPLLGGDGAGGAEVNDFGRTEDRLYSVLYFILVQHIESHSELSFKKIVDTPCHNAPGRLKQGK